MQIYNVDPLAEKGRIGNCISMLMHNLLELIPPLELPTPQILR